nr:MAG TPA: hypothetical protein [Caudoviricetes sp.]
MLLLNRETATKSFTEYFLLRETTYSMATTLFK